MTLLPKESNDVGAKFHHYEKWEATLGDCHIKVEGRAKDRYVKIGLSSSARGAECYAYEIPKLIKALQQAKVAGL